MSSLGEYRTRALQTLEPEVDLICGSDITPQPIRWLWDGWLAKGKFHVLAGPPGTGKTTVACALAATLSCGGRWPDGTPARPGRVLIWSGEDDPQDTLVPRLIACGADREQTHFISGVRDGGEGGTAFDPAIHAEYLLSAAIKVGGIDLLIVDPIVSAVSGDSHKNAEVRRGLQPLVALGEKLGCAILGISHFSKGTSGRDPVERVTGSIAFGALARLVFAAAKMPEHDLEGGSRLFVRSKSNIGADSGGFRYDLQQVELETHPGVFASRLVWGTAVDGTARELLQRADAQPEENGDGMSPQDQWLFDFLTHEQKSSTECFAEGKAAGFSEKQIRTARERLNIKPLKHGFHGGWVWSLPAGTFDPNQPQNVEDAQDAQDAKVKEALAPSGTLANSPQAKDPPENQDARTCPEVAQTKNVGILGIFEENARNEWASSGDDVGVF